MKQTGGYWDSGCSLEERTQAKSTGGFAFPSQNHPGMTLRDYFAGQALHNANLCPGRAPEWELTNWFGPDQTNIRQAEIAARQAYEIADAMLAARDT